MLTFTFAGDESGDASFNFVRGASRYADLIAGAIWRRDTHNDTGTFDAIERKNRKLVEYAG